MGKDMFIFCFLLQIISVIHADYSLVNYLSDYYSHSYANFNDTCFETGEFCKSCDTLMYCDGTTEIGQADCKDIDPLKPFCNPNTKQCQATDTCEDNFICKYEGLIPNIKNCNSFYYCQKSGEKPDAYDCPKKLSYDHTIKSCKMNGVCVNFSSDTGICKDKANKIVGYPGDESIFVRCPVKSGPLKMQTCSSSGQKVVTSNQIGVCELYCKSEGIYPDPVKKDMFYMCYKNGTNFSYLPVNCVKGTTFNPEKKFCVRDGSGTTEAPTTTDNSGGLLELYVS